MPTHLIEQEPRKWKKDKWRSLSPPKVQLIKFCRRLKIIDVLCGVHYATKQMKVLMKVKSEL
jgi:hypothetical protein